MSTSVRDSFRQIANDVRAIAGRDFSIRPYTVERLESVNAGDYQLEGTETETAVEITVDGQPPKVRWLSDEELALGGMASGTVEVGPITPDHAGGGHSWAVLCGGDLSEGDRLAYRLTGPEHPTGALYRFCGGKHDRALHYLIRLRPIAAT